MGKHDSKHLKLVTKLITDALQARDKPPQEETFTFFKGVPIRMSAGQPINPIVQGSMGLLLHGVDFETNNFDNPGDVDILISNQKAAIDTLTKLDSELQQTKSHFRIQINKEQGPELVLNCIVVDTTGKHPDLEIQLVDIHDFGMQSAEISIKEGIPTLSIKETLISLESGIKIRGARPKDKFAYFYLLNSHGKELLNDKEIQQQPKVMQFIMNHLNMKSKELEELLYGAKPGNSP